MLECNRNIQKKLTALIRVVAILLPALCAVLLTSQVVFAKNTFVINDGDRVHYHTTYTTDPMEVLEEAGFELGAEDTYTTEDGVGMSEITIRRVHTVEVTFRGETQKVTVNATTVAALLEQLSIAPDAYDVLSTSVEDETYDGMVITIERRNVMEETYTLSVPYGTLYVLDTTLAADQQVVLSQGIEGQIQNVDNVSYCNGLEVSRENLSATVISEPVDQILAVGSLEGIDPSLVMENEFQSGPETTGGDGQLFIGDGMIITPDGQILTYTDTMSVVATAYNKADEGCTDYTAIGSFCRVGAIAVDPRMIPYGTRMYIVTNDGQYIYGIAVAEDCGGSIKGNRIDLYFDTVDECWEFGIRNATVYFLG